MMKIRDKILDILKKEGKMGNAGWFNTACPFCDKKGTKKPHFYLQLKEGTPLVYKCFRASCMKSGLLNKNVAKSIGILNSDVLSEIEDLRLKYSKGKKDNIEYHKNIKKSIKLPELSEVVKNYFTSRTLVDASEYQDVFRIASSLKEFYKMYKNKIYYPNIKTQLYRESKSDFIYFFNDTYTQVLFRELKPDGRKGKLSLIDIPKNSNKSHKPYSIKGDGKYKLHNEFSSTLVLAEGPFDIINAYLLLKDSMDGWFISGGGFSSTKKVINEFTKYYGFPHIIIMSDSDVDLSIYKKRILPSIKNRISDMIVFYNIKGKDIGDRSEVIEFKKYHIYKNDMIEYD